jgi:NTE family protein
MRTIKNISLLLLGLSAVQLSCHAEEQQARRPRIGLVLGGGGARGTAHIGVLEVLEKLHVPVDCVAGTSMGSLIAGAYLSGTSPDQMVNRLSKVNWGDLFDDNPAQTETNYRERQLDKRFYPGLELGIVKNELQMEHGVVGGQKIKLFFNNLVGADKGARNIESLPVPLSIITTDIGTGERVVFRSGELSTAMRASMSVPVLLAPVHYQGRYLVDGGLVDNIPVDEVRERCNADVVIAVDVGSPLSNPKNIGNVLTVANQMIGILTEQNAIVARASLKKSDIYIKPDLEGITAADFNKFREGAERGRVAAEAQADRLRQYAVPEAEYLAWVKRIEADNPPPPRIDEVQIAGLKNVNPEAVQKHLHVEPGSQLNTVQLEKDIGRIYGDGDFESVDYSLLNVRDRNILRITPVEKSWGPDYLRMGMNLEASSKQNDFALRAAYHMKWINSLGGEWLSGIQLGEKAQAFTQFYQPLDDQQRFFIEPSLGVQRNRQGVFQDDNRIADLEVRNKRIGLDLGANLGVLGQLRVGRVERWTNGTITTGTPSFPIGDADIHGWNLALDVDQFDRAFFPTKGWSAHTVYFKEDSGYSKLTADLRAAHSWGPYVANGRVYYVSAYQGNLPVADAPTLGGFLNLSGFARDQIIAEKVQFASVRGEKIIGKMPLGLSGDIRVGLSLETGKADDRFTETNRSGWMQAGSLYLGGETPIGPIYLGYGLARGGPNTYYLFIGLP